MKKILVTILTTAMVASMVACGGKNNTTTESTETPAASTESVSTETVSSETEATEQATEGEAATGETLGQTLLTVFKDQLATNPEMTAQELADVLISNEKILFSGMTMPVEEGFLMGFNADITGFEEAVTFGPMIGTIPFMGYVFTLAEDADVDAFVATLETNANPAWNVCTEAEETVMEAVGNKVFFLMCPVSLEN